MTTTPAKPSRTVTAKCVVCARRFKPARIDAKYCKDACRQFAQRRRDRQPDYALEIEKARMHYWSLMYDEAIRRGVSKSELLSDQTQIVDLNGDVWMGAFPGKPGARWVGNTGCGPHRPGFVGMGAECAPPPWRVPPFVPPGPRHGSSVDKERAAAVAEVESPA